MSLEAHHRFILDTMQRNQDIARNIINELEAEVARLKAEVERLNEAWVDKKMQEDRDALLQQVERLTKAGDAFYESEIGYYGEQILNDPKHHSGQMCRDWNAAKEGKPSA
jgi:hypothetical protein